MEKDIGNKKTSTYVNINTVINNTIIIIQIYLYFLSLFWRQMPPGKHLQDTFLINTYEQWETLAVIGWQRSQEALWFLSTCYWFSIDSFQCLCSRSFKSLMSSSKLLMPLGLETGFWSILWMAWSSAPGSTMQLVTRNVWLITISLQDGGRPLTGQMTKWSAPPITPGWCHLSTERYGAPCWPEGLFFHQCHLQWQPSHHRANRKHSK